MRARLFGLLFFGTVAAFSLSPAVPFISSPAAAAEVRSDIGDPINKARKLAADGRFSEALSVLRKADAVGDKTDYETYALELTRGSIAQSAGDNGVAIHSFEAVLGTSSCSDAMRPKLTEVIAELYYGQQDYANFIPWAERFFKAGGDNPSMKTALVDAYYLSNNFSEAESRAEKMVTAATDAGNTPDQHLLQVWESSAHNLNDDDGFRRSLELVVTYYPAAADWRNLFILVQHNLSDRLSLDGERFEHAVGILTDPDDIVTAVQDAIQLGYPGEAQGFIDYGYQTGVLGTGNNAPRHARLRALVEKDVAADQKALPQAAAEAERSDSGDGLLHVGYSYVTYGDTDKGLSLMEEGMAKGNLKHQGESQLHLGIAYLKAGQKDKAIDALKAVDDSDGSTDLAKLWIIQAGHS